jgi:hypothetical protein
MTEAYKVCFFKNDVEEEGEVLPATYDDLLSYYNQFYHQQIDRNLDSGCFKKPERISQLKYWLINHLAVTMNSISFCKPSQRPE